MRQKKYCQAELSQIKEGGRSGGAVQRSIYGITVTVCFIDLHSAAIKPLKTSWVKTKRFGADNEC